MNNSVRISLMVGVILMKVEQMKKIKKYSITVNKNGLNFTGLSPLLRMKILKRILVITLFWIAFFITIYSRQDIVSWITGQKTHFIITVKLVK